MRQFMTAGFIVLAATHPLRPAQPFPRVQVLFNGAKIEAILCLTLLP